MPYLEFLASTVLEIWRGHKISKVGHMTLSRPSWPNFAFCSLVPLVVCMRAKFGVPSFNRSRDMEGSQYFKSRSRDPFPIPFDVILHCNDSAICTESVCEISSLLTDIWLFYYFPYFAAKCLFPPILGSLFRVWPPKCSQILSRPQKAHPWPETRVLAYRSCRSVKKCDLGAWRRKQNKNEKKVTDVTSHIFAQTTHVALSPLKLSCGVEPRT